jgi:hypothetical protein
VNRLLLLVALVLLLIGGAIAAGWITSAYALAFIAFGLAAWVLAGLVT